MDYITILGSCRQIPVKNYFNTSKILNELNYPHCTKEILQQIRYLKYKNIEQELTKYCFCSKLLNNCESEITDDEYNILKEEFDKTSFFLVEISSKISYKWNNLYLHHIATEDRYCFYDKNNIIKSDLTDDEIENDIIQIRNEVYPKPLIIISYFSTYESGETFELIQLLKNICEKLNIPFLNQIDIVKEYGSNILINESVLAHYTNDGLNYVGKILFDKINQVKENNSIQKYIYQVYYTSEERTKKYSFQGFGDYIRGTIYLYQLLKNINIILKVNFSNHILSNLFICDNHLTIKECEEETKYILYNLENGENCLDYKYIFTNKLLLSNHIEDDCKEFIIKNCLTPRINFINKISLIKKNLNLNDYNYSIIHIRTYDNEIFDQNRLNNILNLISLIYSKNNNEKMLLISNNEIYLSYIDFSFIQHTNLKKAHVGLYKNTLEECQDTMIEFMLMTTSKKIYQLSVYDWGSGFSDTINKIYDVPIEQFKI